MELAPHQTAKDTWWILYSRWLKASKILKQPIVTLMVYMSTLEPQSTHPTQNHMWHCTLTANPITKPGNFEKPMIYAKLSQSSLFLSRTTKTINRTDRICYFTPILYPFNLFTPATAYSATLIRYYYPLSEIGTAHTMIMETTAMPSYRVTPPGWHLKKINTFLLRCILVELPVALTPQLGLGEGINSTTTDL